MFLMTPATQLATSPLNPDPFDELGLHPAFEILVFSPDGTQINIRVPCAGYLGGCPRKRVLNGREGGQDGPFKERDAASISLL